MIDLLHKRKRRVQAITSQLDRTRHAQFRCRHELADRLEEWATETKTLAAMTVTGYVWAGNVKENRGAGRNAAPLKELLGATWLVMGWKNLPGRLENLIELPR